MFPGDVVLIREHTPHHLASRAGGPCVPLAEAMATVSGVGRRLEVGDPSKPVAATFFCGAYRFQGDLCQSLLQALPEMLPLRPAVADLAEHALLSRSAFARQFTELLGVPPLTYLNDWRMALARERLRDSDARLASIGATLGYASEFSFAAAFKRHHGTAPGRWRREASITT